MKTTLLILVALIGGCASPYITPPAATQPTQYEMVDMTPNGDSAVVYKRGDDGKLIYFERRKYTQSND